MTATTVYSLSEITAHARKAARGAGFAWGYAEEVAQAVRLLAAHQLPGAVVLAAYLAERADTMVFCGPVRADDLWSAPEPKSALCPVLSGAMLFDDVAVVQAEQGLVLTQLAYPLLLLPYIALLSQRLGCAFQLNWEAIELVCEQGRLLRIVEETDTALLAARTARFSCRVLAVSGVGVTAGQRGQAISAAVWQGLNHFAQQTYVPATEASRRGAGPAN